MVYGDWLVEHDDPRGELVAVQMQLERAPGDVGLRAQQTRLLAQHGLTWLGNLAALGDDDLEVRWSRGFVDALRIGSRPDVVRASTIDLAAAVADLARLPHAAFVRELVIGGVPRGGSWAAVLDAIARCGVPSNLVRLELHHGRGDRLVANTAIRDVARANGSLAQLRELRIAMETIELGAIDLPALRVLELAVLAIEPQHVAALRERAWPALEHVSLHATGGAEELGDLAPLLDGIARVRHFGYRGVLSDALCARLQGTALLAQLGTLALSPTEAGARELVAHADAYRHLTRIDLSHGHLSAVTRARLAEVMWPRVT
jgi:hypothetical protein